MKLLEKGKFVCDRFEFNAGERFPAYYRIYEIDGNEVRIEKSNFLSGYGMKHLQKWTVTENHTGDNDEFVAKMISKKYQIEVTWN